MDCASKISSCQRWLSPQPEAAGSLPSFPAGSTTAMQSGAGRMECNCASTATRLATERNAFALSHKQVYFESACLHVDFLMILFRNGKVKLQPTRTLTLTAGLAPRYPQVG